MGTSRFGYTAFVIDAFAGVIPGWECSLSKKTAFVGVSRGSPTPKTCQWMFWHFFTESMPFLITALHRRLRPRNLSASVRHYRGDLLSGGLLLLLVVYGWVDP
jgi:hypothetical protein